MQVYSKTFRVIKQEEAVPGCRLMCLDAPEIARAAVPGQFLHVRCRDGQDPILRRPISIHFIDREQGRVYILYRVAGRGTALLARVPAGDEVDVIGPLGKGYTLPAAGERVAVVGGGMGAAPLLFLLKEIAAIPGRDAGLTSVFLGAPGASSLPGAEQVRKLGFSLEVATDDGSGGFKGTVVELFSKKAGGLDFDRIYACGPKPMLRSLAAAVGAGTSVEVSVEERMGCGVGACLSCACKVRSGPGEEFKNAHVCIDGPVFNLRELVL